jgi:hypothetical protein
MQSNQCSACQLVTLDWSGHQITANSLESGGEIRYARVGMYQGRRLDVVLTLSPGANPDCSGSNDACQAMPASYYGGIAVKRGAGRELALTLTLRYTDDNQPAVRRPSRTPADSLRARPVL